jgi:hypothetical protein
MYEKNSNRWIDFLDECLFAYRITKGDPTSKSPYELYFVRKPNLVFSLPEINEREMQHPNSFPEVIENDYEKISIVSQQIMEVTRSEREVNAKKMKKRWDTSNTQQAKVGDYVLTEKILHDQPMKTKKKKKAWRRTLREARNRFQCLRKWKHQREMEGF